MSSITSIFKESSRHFEGQEKDERVVLLLRKHPFTILLPLSFILLAGLIPIALILTLYSMILESGYLMPLLFLTSIFYLALWLSAFYHLAMYTLNTVIITDKRIIDRDQHGFFNIEISELYLYHIQDVTIHVKGVIRTFLKYGEVHVQTAASEKEFVFNDIPDPDEVKNTIMKLVREKQKEDTE